jgi:hypothetical protein
VIGLCLLISMCQVVSLYLLFGSARKRKEGRVLIRDRSADCRGADSRNIWVAEKSQEDESRKDVVSEVGSLCCSREICPHYP